MLIKNFICLFSIVLILMLFVSGQSKAQNPGVNNSISGQLTNMEMRLYNQSYDNDTVIQRLQRLETEILGQTQNGAIMQRVNTLNNAFRDNSPDNNNIMPSSQNQNNGYVQPPVIAAPIDQGNRGHQQNYVPPPVNSYKYPLPSDSSSIPGLKTRFEPGLTNDEKLPSKEEIKKFKQETNKQNNLTSEEESSLNQTEDENNSSLTPENSENVNQTPDASAEDNKKKKKKKGKNKNNKDDEEEPTFDPLAENYFDALMYVNQDKVVRWKKMPVTIFLPPGNNITYRSEYRAAAIRALNLWKVKSNGIIDYVLTDNPKKADIMVVWQENFPEVENKTGETTTRTGYNLNQAATGNIISSASMFVPGYYGYGASLLGYLVGGLGNSEKIRDVKLRIGTLPAMKLPKENAVNVIESITSHEFGHALGITCHSVNVDDIMYYELPFDGTYAKSPSGRDINTAIKLYSTEPDITD